MKSILIVFLILIASDALSYEVTTEEEDLIENHKGNASKSKVASLWFVDTDSPAECGTEKKGLIYSDSSLNNLCICNGSSWCPVSGGTCGTSTSCD